MIGVYDLNTSSVLNIFYLEAEKKGIKFYNTDDLKDIVGLDKVIINPLPFALKKHCENIKEYIEENPNTKILLFTPYNYPEEIKKLIGSHDNLECITTCDDEISEKVSSFMGGKE